MLYRLKYILLIIITNFFELILTNSTLNLCYNDEFFSLNYTKDKFWIPSASFMFNEKKLTGQTFDGFRLCKYFFYFFYFLQFLNFTDLLNHSEDWIIVVHIL